MGTDKKNSTPAMAGDGFKLDETDIRILGLLQRNAGLPVSDVARKVGLSVTPCWRRIQRLEESGVIRRRVVLLDADKIGAGISVFVSIRTNEHNAEWLRHFTDVILPMPEVVEFYRMSGDIDYLLRVVVAGMVEYDAFYQRLISRVKLTDVSSSFALEQIKFTTALPLPAIGDKANPADPTPAGPANAAAS